MSTNTTTNVDGARLYIESTGMWVGPDVGILYYPNGAMRYVGELNGILREGRGITYNPNGTKQHEGEYKDDLFHGEGSLYALGLKTQGIFINGILQGEANQTDEHNLRQQAEFANGLLMTQWAPERNQNT